MSAPDLPNLLIFGGTFDPPHQAHVDGAGSALARFPAARLVVTPGAVPAGAGGEHKAPQAAFAHRLAMCALAFGPLGPRVEVSSVEARLPAPNYTVTTLREMAREAPAARLGFLLGQDQLASFARWQAPAEVLALASLIVLPRPGGTPAELPLPAVAAEVARALGASAAWDEAGQCLWLPALGRGFYLLPRPVGTAASRRTREALAHGAAAPAGWLPAVVEGYILKHHLYART